ncbi:MAG: hypothetical protein O3C43_06710 [Verrucomicrobia bacterium]|nr:hypothetical protein [Verrucomicrobiota bacterium]MDA1066178.1 hypothetical protein [Verrucomicrobiota bacterium]
MPAVLEGRRHLIEAFGGFPYDMGIASIALTTRPNGNQAIPVISAEVNGHRISPLLLGYDSILIRVTIF